LQWTVSTSIWGWKELADEFNQALEEDSVQLESYFSLDIISYPSLIKNFQLLLFKKKRGQFISVFIVSM